MTKNIPICLFLFLVFFSSGQTQEATPVAPVKPTFQLGIDVLADRGFRELKGKKIGLVTNPSGVDGRGTPTWQRLREALGANLVALYGPEHGVFGMVGAGKNVSGEKHGVDLNHDGKISKNEETGLKVFSLYGDTRKPTQKMLEGVDAIVYDLQDVGCRSYTFISTLGLVMEAAQEKGIEVIVLDRPNPLGAFRVEGPRPAGEMVVTSFIGQYDIPYVYGLTIGELAKWINKVHLQRPCRLTVVPMKGWIQQMTWEDTGLKWVATSPNIPRVEATRGYVATGFFGELGVSNGANPTGVSTKALDGAVVYPFDIIALENVDAEEFCRSLTAWGFNGMKFTPFRFHPIGKYHSVVMSGAKVVIDPKAPCNLTALNIAGLEILRRMLPKKNFFSDAENTLMFDKLNRTRATRKAVEAGTSARQIVASWELGVAKWREERKPYLIYPESAEAARPKLVVPAGRLKP
ncbi:MAG: DUF1343 domain-containing protein [Verrucomicrobia bacterium]|nr:DUF1343 domain-containing protein [Verrucomicrobiota bacterium]